MRIPLLTRWQKYSWKYRESLLVRVAVSDAFTFVGTDVPGMLQTLQRERGLKEEPLESSLVAMTKSHTQGQPEEDISVVSQKELMGWWRDSTELRSQC